MKIKNLLLFILLLWQRADAQFSYVRNICYNDTMGAAQYYTRMIETMDHKYVFLQTRGRVGSDYSEIHVTKTDTAGNVIWSNHIAHVDTSGQYAANYGGIVQLPDSGFAISGNNLGGRIGLIRCDKNGNLLWVKQYNNNLGANDFNNSQLLVVGNNIIIPTNLQGLVHGSGYIKTDMNGTVISSHFTNINNHFSESYATENTSDGGFVFGSHVTTASNNSDCGMIKYDASGNVQWTHHYYNSSGYFHVWDVKEIPGGGYIMCGEFTTATLQLYGFLCSVSSTGQMQWAKTMNTHQTRFLKINFINANEFIVSAYRFVPVLNDENLHLKVNISGTILDGFAYTPVTGGYVPLWCGMVTSDNKYIAYGSAMVNNYTTSSTTILKTDINTFDGCNKSIVTDVFTPVTFIDSTQYIIAPNGITDSIITQQYVNYFVTPYVQTICGTTGVNDGNQSDMPVQIYPGRGLLNIDFGNNRPGRYLLSIFDISGREIYAEHFDNKKTVSVPVHLSEAIYVVKLTGDSWTKQKLVAMGH